MLTVNLFFKKWKSHELMTVERKKIYIAICTTNLQAGSAVLLTTALEKAAADTVEFDFFLRDLRPIEVGWELMRGA